jgi:phenylalanyl-tRNA synthetase beta chain
LPTIETKIGDLEKILRHTLPKNPEELEDLLSNIKGEISKLDGDDINIELKDSNRPDLWSAEGITRSLRTFMGLDRPRQYVASGSSGVNVIVNSELKDIRPYIGCSVVKSVQLDDVAIKGLMHLQDKLDMSYGRGRNRSSIGLYDFNLIQQPIQYQVSKPDETTFTPLGFSEPLTLSEILAIHPKGREYGHIVKPYQVWPILKDAKNAVLSFPPIINSNDLGKINEDTENILIEVTGAPLKVVLDVLDIVAMALVDREGTIETVEISYPYSNLETLTTPILESQNVTLEPTNVKNILGLDLTLKEIINFLHKAGIKAYAKQDAIQTEIPCYRKDILHPVDLVEDIAIAYGFNRIVPQWPQYQTFGSLTADTHFYDHIRELMIGYQFQEILTFSLSNSETLFDKMMLDRKAVIELENPKMGTFTTLRNWMIPNLIEFSSHNTHIEYPQKLFEVGICVKPDINSTNGTEEWKSLAATIAHPQAGYTEIRGIVDSLLLNLRVKTQIQSAHHPSFIDGRMGKIVFEDEVIGIIGEVHPEILEKWGLEVPIAAFEINLTKIKSMLNIKNV